MNRRSIYSLVLAAGLVAAGAVAYAEQRAETANDALPAAAAQGHVSLIQAVQTAELHTSGKARSAEYEHSRDGWVYDVEVISGAKVFDVRVNASSGVVISAQEDQPDGPGEHGEHGGKDKED